MSILIETLYIHWLVVISDNFKQRKETPQIPIVVLKSLLHFTF